MTQYTIEEQNIDATLLVYLNSTRKRDPLTINANSIANHWKTMKSQYAWYKPIIGKEEKAKLKFVRKMKKLGLGTFENFIEGLELSQEKGLIEEIESLRGKWNVKHYKESSKLFEINHDIGFNRKHIEAYSKFPSQTNYTV